MALQSRGGCYKGNMRKSTTGFTIIELLIVIVIIAILAAITLVAYGGIKSSAINNQTEAAFTQWIKALHMYKIDNGSWPHMGTVLQTCLGQGYKYGPTASDTPSGNQCRSDGNFVENTTFESTMSKYFSGQLPTPAMVTYISSDGTVWYRGISYYYGGGTGTSVYVKVVMMGVACPVMSGIQPDSLVSNNGVTSCSYVLGQTTDT